MVAVVRRRGRKRSLRSTGGAPATSSGGSPQKSSPRRAPRTILPAAGAKLWLHPSATPPKGPFWPGAEPVADRGRPHRTRARTANQWIFRAGEMGFWRLISSITPAHTPTPHTVSPTYLRLRRCMKQGRFPRYVTVLSTHGLGV